MSKPQSKIELEPVAVADTRPDFLKKEVLETFDEVARFKGWYRQPSNTLRRPCIVTRELFELITEEDMGSPLIQVGDHKPISVPIIDGSRKEEGLAILKSTFNSEMVII